MRYIIPLMIGLILGHLLTGKIPMIGGIMRNSITLILWVQVRLPLIVLMGQVKAQRLEF